MLHALRLVLPCLIAVLAVACAAETTPNDRDELVVDPNVPAGFGVSIHADGDTVLMSYIGGDGSPGCLVTRSDDGGATWGAPVTVDPAGTGQTSIHVTGQDVRVAYSGQFPDDDVRFAASFDGGASWGSPIVVATDSASTPDVAMTVAGGTVYVAYSYWPGTGVDLRFSRSDDNGLSWAATDVAAGAENEGLSPSIVVADQDIYIGYHNESSLSSMLARSADNGANWQTVAMSPRFAGPITMEGNDIFTTYDADSFESMVFARSSDKGDTWDAQTLTPPEHIAGTRRIAAVGDSLYMSYEAATNADGFSGMRFIRSDDRGATWPEANASVVTATNGNGSTTQHAAINARSGGTVHIAFHDGSPANLKATVSRDNGATWGR